MEPSDMIVASLTSLDPARLEAFGLGCLLAVVVTLFHVTVLDYIASRYRENTQSLRAGDAHPAFASMCLGKTILLMLLLHIVNTCIWAFILYGMKLIPDIHDSFYFSANTYTSLGYGDVPLTRDWRELSPLMAISGLFTFACTTGQLFNVLGSHHEIVSELKLRHRKKNAAA
jgi:hypothetical protein